MITKAAHSKHQLMILSTMKAFLLQRKRVFNLPLPLLMDYSLIIALKNILKPKFFKSILIILAHLKYIHLRHTHVLMLSLELMKANLVSFILWVRQTLRIYNHTNKTLDASIILRYKFKVIQTQAYSILFKFKWV